MIYFITFGLGFMLGAIWLGFMIDRGWTIYERTPDEGKKMTEAVDHPDHYGGTDNPYEVIKVLENWLSREEFIGALKFNVVKYQARASKKNGSQDYEKSAWYSNYLADFLKRNPV